ncbi:MAG: hypothetical protein J7D61_07790 [Marichromatium sp.]|nr:hypothetical protein [Marichromatium sp.]
MNPNENDELEEALQRGAAARALLESDAFNQVVEELQRVYFAEWLQATDAGERERLHARATALRDIVDELMGRHSRAEYITLNQQRERNGS